jgi:hypothetical protein
MPKPKKVLIIDGDLVAYRSAAAVEKRTIIAKHIKSGRTKEFNTRTELKELCKSKDIEYNKEDYEITDVQTPEDISHALYIVKNLVKKLSEELKPDSTEMYIGSGENFRHRLPLPSPYKANRAEGLRPKHLKEVREYLMTQFNCSYVKDIETDDVITIRAYEELAKGNIPILSTIDKDAQQTQGVIVKNFAEGSEFDEELQPIPLVGNLYKTELGIKGNGLKFLAFQTLSGDPSDTYSGYELSKVKYGPVKAYKALEPCQTEQEVLEVLIQQYKLLYPEPVEYTDVHGVEHTATWRDLLEMYWRCAYMKRSWEDASYFWDYARERGVHWKDYFNDKP